MRFPGSELVPLACDLNAELKHPGGQSVLDAKLEVPVTSLVLLGARQGWARVRLPLEHSGSTLLPARNRSMTASLRWDGVVSPLWAYLPIADRRMAGGLHLAADISGTLSQPKIDANVELSNAAFEDLALGILLKNINARAAYTDQGGGTKRDAGRQASLALSGEDGQGGTIRLDGSLDLTARSMQASLNMNKLKPLRRQDLRISLSGDGLVMGTLEAPFVNCQHHGKRRGILAGPSAFRRHQGTADIQWRGNRDTSAQGGSQRAHRRAAPLFRARTGIGKRMEGESAYRRPAQRSGHPRLH